MTRNKGSSLHSGCHVWFGAMFVLILSVVMLLAGPAHSEPLASTEPVLQVPPFPDDLNLSSVEKLYKSADYRVEVRPAGSEAYQRCFVFETRNDWVLRDFFGKLGPDRMRVIRAENEFGEEKGEMRTASFAQFSFANTAVDVRITLLGPTAAARSATLRPLRHEIHPTIAPDGRVITFTLPRPLKVSLDINDRLNPLFLFADAPDTPEPTAKYYFGPGVHRLPGDGRMTLQSGDHVYIAAGAIVEGRFLLARDSADISIRGRGILSTGEWPHETAAVKWLVKNATFYSSGTHHFTLEGLTLVQGSSWTVAIDDHSGQATHDNLYQNVKMVHWAGNTDAFWITGRHNRVDDCFVFNNDDAIVSKGGGDCHVSNLVVWGGTWGRLMLLFNFGHPISDITVENVDVIGKGAMPQLILAERLQRSGPIEVRNLTFRNVRIEDRAPPTARLPGRLLRLDAGETLMRFSQLRFENVTLDQQFPDEGVLTGTPDQPVTGVTFENLHMGGRLIGSAEEAHLKLDPNVSGVEFKSTP